MKSEAFLPKPSKAWKQRGREQIFFIPREVVPMSMNPLEQQPRHPNGTTRAKPRQHLCAPGSSGSPPPPAEQQGGVPAPATGTWAGPRHKATRKGLAPGSGSPWLLLCLPPRPCCNRSVWGTCAVREGGFYQSQSHREEELILCLNGAKVVQHHQQGLET